jgi:hypothetical protein
MPVSTYFADATLTSASVACWWASFKVEAAGGVFRVREDEPGAASHWCGPAPDAVTASRMQFGTRIRRRTPSGPSASVPNAGGSEKRKSQVIYLARRDPTTSCLASRAEGPDASRTRTAGLPNLRIAPG